MPQVHGRALEGGEDRRAHESVRQHMLRPYGGTLGSIGDYVDIETDLMRAV